MNDPKRFRNDLPRGKHLVTTAELFGLQRQFDAPTSAWRLFEVGCGAPTGFRSGHIPGAGYLDTECLETLPFWNKVRDAQLVHYLLRLGVSHDCTVVLYGRPGPDAARAAHLLLYIGVPDVRLLDGGFDAWVSAGLPVAAGDARTYAPAQTFGRTYPANPHWLIDLERARTLSRQANTTLVSIRSWAEFSGQLSGYSYIHAQGEIPGARWGRAGIDGDVNSMSDFQQNDGTMKPAHEITAFWREQGIERHKNAVLYCGTGWRASMAFFYAWLMGWEEISVFDGGWFEWSSAYPPQQEQPTLNPPRRACLVGQA